MSAPSVIFWPADLANRVVRSPVAVLRQAAGELTTMTGGLLEGQVSTVKESPYIGGIVRHTLHIVAAGLDRYAVELLAVTHRSEMPYPVAVYAEELKQLDEMGDSLYPMCADDGQLTITIRDVLQADRVRSILVSLLARLNDASELPSTT